MDTPLRLAVDFDGVIHDPTNKKPGYKLGQPMEDAQDALLQLKMQGAIIIIHTIWADTEQKCQAIAKWCQYFKIPYDFITNIKPKADCYLDDHGYQFTNWTDALDHLSRLNREIRNRSSV